jgi:hypothetical protein
MLGGVNRLIIRISGSALLFVVATIIATGCLMSLTRIGQSFPAVSGGAPPFDLQNGLTAGQVLQQLAGFTEGARRQYLLFTAIDYVFPLAAGLCLAAAGAFGLRHGFPGFYAELARRNLFPLFLTGSLFDWCENVTALTAIMTYPDTSAGVVGALIVAKRLKLFFVFATQGLVLLLLLVAAGKSIIRRLGRRLASS